MIFYARIRPKSVKIPCPNLPKIGDFRIGPQLGLSEVLVNPWHKTLGQHSARQKSSHASCASRPMPHSTCATPNTRLRACQRCSQTWCFPCFILAHYISIVLTPRVRTESKEQATIPRLIGECGKCQSRRPRTLSSPRAKMCARTARGKGKRVLG